MWRDRTGTSSPKGCCCKRRYASARVVVRPSLLGEHVRGAYRCGEPGARVSLADDLAPIAVTDLGGAQVPLGTLWRERPVVLVFIRHFG